MACGIHVCSAQPTWVGRGGGAITCITAPPPRSRACESSCRVRRSWKVICFDRARVLPSLLQSPESRERKPGRSCEKPDAMSVRWKAIPLTGRCGSVAPQETHCVSVRQSTPLSCQCALSGARIQEFFLCAVVCASPRQSAPLLCQCAVREALVADSFRTSKHREMWHTGVAEHGARFSKKRILSFRAPQGNSRDCLN